MRDNTFTLWRIYHPQNIRLDEESAETYPPFNKTPCQLLTTAENEEGDFDGYLVTTVKDEPFALTDYWVDLGWLVEEKGVLEKVSLDPAVPEEPEIIVVHNAWTVYALQNDGSIASEPLATLSRPQDWGDPKWHYERFKFEWQTARAKFVNHAHCWTDMPSADWPHFFAPLIVSIIMPGRVEALCGPYYLDPEDFWSEEWGEKPPVRWHDDEQDEEESGW